MIKKEYRITVSIPDRFKHLTDIEILHLMQGGLRDSLANQIMEGSAGKGPPYYDVEIRDRLMRTVTVMAEGINFNP